MSIVALAKDWVPTPPQKSSRMTSVSFLFIISLQFQKPLSTSRFFQYGPPPLFSLQLPLILYYRSKCQWSHQVPNHIQEVEDREVERASGVVFLLLEIMILRTGIFPFLFLTHSTQNILFASEAPEKPSHSQLGFKSRDGNLPKHPLKMLDSAAKYTVMFSWGWV